MAKSPPQPDLGTIVEYDDLGAFRLALVTGFIGKKKLIVVTADNVERRTATGTLTFSFPERWSGEPNEVASMLDRLEDAVEESRQAIKLRPLWDQTHSNAKARQPDEYARLVFDAPTPEERLATLRELRDDRYFFRERKRGWEPRSVADVERLQRQAANRLQAELERAAFVERLAEVLSSHEETLELAKSALTEPNFRQRAQQLQAFAAGGDEHEGRSELDDILDAVEERLGHQLRGYGSSRAFWVCVELGLFTEHEDLGVWQFQATRNTSTAAERAREVVATQWSPDAARTNFTDWWTCTIDDPSSHDLDDALSIRARTDGGWTLAVHIADPSAFVERDDALDRYALHAATSLYLPTGSVAMFPREVTEHAMSLVAGQRRPALTTVFEFNSSLALESVEWHVSVIEVDRRMSYDEVDALLQGAPIPDAPVESIFALRHIADELLQIRRDGGAVELAFPETKLVVDLSDAKPTAEVRFFDGSPARALVGELMIATNVAAADYCTRHEIPVFYRVQDPPDGDVDDPEILAIPAGPARELARIKRMRKSVTTTHSGEHSGLGVAGYAQITSPIRRYTDLVAQRQIKAHLRGEELPYDEDQLVELLGIVDRALYEAREVERRSQDYWMVWLLGQVREPLRAEVIDHRSDGKRATVFLTDYGYRAITGLKQEVELGDKLLLEVTRADPRTGTLSLREA